VKQGGANGFTITELLIAVAVASIASVLMVTAFVFVYGDVIREQVKTSMVRDSQVFLRRMVEDIRVASEVRTTNLLTDINGDTWTTSDPANILVTTEPATDSSDDLIFDPDSGEIYFHEVVYFSQGNTMYRRLIANPEATGASQSSTCPSGTAGCPPDIELVSNVDNMLFEFYDVSDNLTAVPEEARSVQVTINLARKTFGVELITENTSRITLRNE